MAALTLELKYFQSFCCRNCHPQDPNDDLQGNWTVGKCDSKISDNGQLIVCLECIDCKKCQHHVCDLAAESHRVCNKEHPGAPTTKHIVEELINFIKQ